MTKISLHPAEQYAADIRSGKLVASRYVKLAVDRYYRDRETGHERGITFDRAAAQRTIDFFRFLRLTDGAWSGKPFILAPYQQFIQWNLYGFKREDGSRRFRKAYCEISKKNGKSTWLGGLGLYHLLADHEPSANVVSAATGRVQAKEVWDSARKFVLKSPLLKKRVDVRQNNLSVVKTFSNFYPVSSEANTLDGKNVSFVSIDELHRHPNREIYDVFAGSGIARTQPLMAMITTSGFDRHSICWEQRDYTRKILTQQIFDDAFFGVVYGLDQKYDWPDLDADDDWCDEATWTKANPNLGVSITRDALADIVRESYEKPASQNNTKRLHFGIWTQSVSRWLDPAAWAACYADYTEEDLLGRPCYAGLDLSTTTDLSAFVLVFPPIAENEPYKVLARFFCPSEGVHRRAAKDRVPYDVWQRESFLTATPGDVIDHEFILAQIAKDCDAFDVREIAFDRWGSQVITARLSEGHGENFLVQFGQGYASMSPPCKELERLVAGRDLTHNGNPVLSWNIDNAVTTSDAAGNIKLDKAKATERIDGAVALIMGLDRATRHGTASAPSVYESAGITFLG